MYYITYKIGADKGQQIKQTRAVMAGILKFSLGGGLIASSLVFPGAAMLADPVFKALNKLEPKDREKEIKRIVSYMEQQKLVEVQPKADGSEVITITGKGKKRKAKLIFETMMPTVPDKWDGKWRLVIFDIPEKQRHARDNLRAKLTTMGFVQIQKSIWAHPFDAFEQLELIKSHYRLGPGVTIVEAISVDEDTSHKLRTHFKPLLNKLKM